MDDSAKPPLPTSRKMNNPKSGSHFRTWVTIGLVVILALAVLVWYTHRQSKNSASSSGRHGGAGGANGPTMISTATARTGDIGVYINALGVVTPLSTVSVQSRVAGQIIKVNYQEGQFVHAGDSLVEIDPGPYQAAVLQAQGQLARDKASLADAKLDLDRYKEAFAKNAIPQQQYDTQVATVQQDEGTVQLDQGNLDNAKVNLAYCHITAPITGRVGLRLVDAGNIAQAGGSNLVIITELQPISVIFTVAEDYLPQILEPVHQGKTLSVAVFDRTQQHKIATGTLATLDNQIDTATGTLKLRALFTNDDESLFPNQFVNAQMLVDTHTNVILLPNPAIQRNDDGAFVYLVQTEETNTTVVMHTVTAGTTDGNVSEVTGLDDGAVVAADNFNRLTDGAQVILRPANDDSSTNSVTGAKSGHKHKKPAAGGQESSGTNSAGGMASDQAQ